jgi:nucleoside-diphosphate-sugar epimerase
MAKALVAGGAGFVGSHLCELLLEKGYTVHAIDNLVTGARRNIQHLMGKGLNWLEIDITSDFYLNDSYDEIYNLASPASPTDFEKMPTFILETGSRGHKNLLKQAKEMKAKILFASTSEVYGDPLEHPQQEEYRGNVNPIGIRSCYDEAKRYGEALTMAFNREHNVDTRIVRIFNTYGPRMRPGDGRVIPNFFAQALQKKPLTIQGDGKQTRSLCFVRDEVEGIYALMQSKETRPVNIGNPNELTILEIAEKINSLTGNTAGLIFKPLPKMIL